MYNKNWNSVNVMKVYRCLHTVEKELFLLNYICSRRGNEKERLMIVNTHDYGNTKDKIKLERMHFFLFLEDALEYQGNHYYPYIGEYEIPDDLVIGNIGCGYYFDMNAPFILETAIPYADVIKDTDEEAYSIFMNGIFHSKIETVTSYTSRVRIIREKVETDTLHVPPHIATSHYCSKIVNHYVEKNPNYKKFLQQFGIVQVLKALNIKLVMQGDLFDYFDVTNKKINKEALKDILIQYDLMEKEKVYSKRK